jgi:SAM-dependent methyltransferase
MDQDLTPRDELMDAGSDAVRFNSPLSNRRAIDLVNRISAFDPESVVDLGCGRGELAVLAAQRLPNTRVIGLDSVEYLIPRAQAAAISAGLENRLTFELCDATTKRSEADAAFCVGASNMFGGLLQTLQELKTTDYTLVLIGDGFWQTEPNAWCLEMLGDLPSSLEELQNLATQPGWTVEYCDSSSIEEWDEFRARLDWWRQEPWDC